MKERKISVLVTGISGTAIGGQVLKALRMAKTSYYIVGIDMSPISQGLFQVDARYLVPAALSSNYIDTLRKICVREKVDVLIPGSEPEVLQISQNRDKLEEIGVTPLVCSQRAIETCMDKSKTYAFLKSNHFNCPKAVLVENEDDKSKVDFYPAMIKPSSGSSGSQNCYLIQNKYELDFFAGFLRRQGYVPLVQEYIGSDDEEYTTGVLSLPDGEIIGSIALRRLLTSGLSVRLKVKSYESPENFVISSGISQGVVEDFVKIRKYSETIARKLGANGPVNIQGRNTEDGFFPFEINPRFSGSTSIRALLGYNEPDILTRYHVLGERPSRVHFKKGYVVRGLSEYYIPRSGIEEIKKEQD